MEFSKLIVEQIEGKLRASLSQRDPTDVLSLLFNPDLSTEAFARLQRDLSVLTMHKGKVDLQLNAALATRLAPQLPPQQLVQLKNTLDLHILRASIVFDVEFKLHYLKAIQAVFPLQSEKKSLETSEMAFTSNNASAFPSPNKANRRPSQITNLILKPDSPTFSGVGKRKFCGCAKSHPQSQPCEAASKGLISIDAVRVDDKNGSKKMKLHTTKIKDSKVLFTGIDLEPVEERPCRDQMLSHIEMLLQSAAALQRK